MNYLETFKEQGQPVCSTTVSEPKIVWNTAKEVCDYYVGCLKLSAIAVQQEKENNMYANQTISTDQDEAKTYLDRRLSDIRREKRIQLYESFHMDGLYPKSPKESKEWLKSGNFRIETPYKDEAYENGDVRFYFSDYFKWGKTGPDVEGYEKAIEKLNAAYALARDIIFVKTDEDARLKALQDFEAYPIN